MGRVNSKLSVSYVARMVALRCYDVFNGDHALCCGAGFSGNAALSCGAEL